MRPFIVLWAWLGVASVAWAQGPATRPAGGMSVLLMPLAPMGDVAATPWIGEAVEQAVYHEISRMAGMRAVVSPARPATAPLDAPAAQKAGLAAGTTLVLFGTYHGSGVDVRVNGLLIEVARGTVVGSARATAPARDLFALEDDFAGQVQRAIARRVAPPPSPERTAARITPAASAAAIPWDTDIAANVERTWGANPPSDPSYDRSLYWYRHSTFPGWYPADAYWGGYGVYPNAPLLYPW